MAVRTVLRNVRIIATDQTTQPPAEDAQAEPKTPPKIVTFELTPDGAKVLALAQQMGDIMLVLGEENEADGPVNAEDSPIFATQISGQTAKPEPLPQVANRSASIVRGAKSRVDVFAAEEQLPGDDVVTETDIDDLTTATQAAIVSVPLSATD
ncbi:RcpC/CpaB family pilus assembly protein [Celeribacter persicus]|uniref:RcpC/CpaB family pilus assembly protein n=1 Tax=Celeribacter persicus TaxID=1651082 RepID=UPI003CCBBB9B